ncbi:N-acetylmuramoyl-L-alanine amidase family protein [Paenibacillus caui]|uniref:N-acetylmuramoyl-L-alanine amidase family protein n=1 Tax=Paenibacillus caui TaxID=2873927 RepID=UPI001F3C8FDE|nr:N-acetylmuramoyl-L-alanine amidase family protein [Paenibacillus caui]
MLFLLLFPGIGHAASAETHINLDGKELTLPKDVQVLSVNGSIMVPLRLVTEKLGYHVDFANKTQTVTIEQSGTILKLVVGKLAAQVNGEEVKMATAPMLFGKTSTKTTLVPLRFVGEQTGAEVSWDNHTKTVYISSPVAGNQEETLPGSGSPGGSEQSAVPVPEAPSDSSSPDTGQTGESGSTSSGGAAPVVPAPVVTAPETTPPEATASEATAPEASAPEASAAASLTNLSFSDNRLILAVNGAVTPKVFSMTNNDRIVIDLENTSLSPDFGSVLPLDNKQSGLINLTGYPDVTDVRYGLFSNSPSTVRVVIDLTGPKAYNLVDNKDGLIIIDLNVDQSAAAPAPGATGKKLVVIDAGHGGSDSGASSLTNRKEKDFTLATVLKVQELLKNEPGIDFVLTRMDDTYPTLEQRVKLANELNAGVFVSIHGNKSPNGGPGPNGVETHYTNAGSLALAEIMQKYLLQASGMADRGLKPGNLYVTKNTKMPSVLLECGFLSNPGDEAAMYSEDFQEKLAEGIVAALKEYLAI